MRIIITDTGFIWNHKNPALEQFKDVVTVVCLNGKKVTDKYECFVTSYKQVGMGIDNYGVSSQRYKALEKMGDRISFNLGYHEDVVLTDYNSESLYAFSVISKEIRITAYIYVQCLRGILLRSIRRKAIEIY